MVSSLISRVVLLVFGTLYPAYRSYKAIKNKDLREYVKWMMYWIIFALFISIETFADIFLSWLPLYYEIKIVFIIWLLSPVTKGSSILYRKFVHPRLLKHEKAIDKYISKAQKNSYAALMDVGKKGFNVATDTFLKTAASGQFQLVETLKRYNSMQDLQGNKDVTDAGLEINRPMSWHENESPTNPEILYNPESDVDILQRQYKTRNAGIQEESIEKHKTRRSQSDDEIQNILPCDDRNENNQNSLQPVSATAPIDDNSINYNYQYTSNTLPRVRKPKKPLYEHYSNRSIERSRYNIDRKGTEANNDFSTQRYLLRHGETKFD